MALRQITGMVVLVGTDRVIVTKRTVATQYSVDEGLSGNPMFKSHPHIVVGERGLTHVHWVGEMLGS